MAHLLLKTTVLSTREEAEEVRSFVLARSNGKDFPPLSGGMHIGVDVPEIGERQYSICSDPRDRTRIRIAVLRDTQGRGGSRWMHDHVAPGQRLVIASPRNNFPLDPDAKHHVLIAGGIGITPFLSMMPELREGRRGFELHYCARSAESAAFHDEIRLNYDDDTVHTHFDGGDPAKGCDIAKLLAEARPDTHVYCCGPKGLIEAVRHAAAHWAPSSVHFERFAGNVPVPEDGTSPFQIELARSGAVIEVDADETALQALARNGIQIDAGCRSGACGACLVDLLDGTPVHRDVCLTDTERKTRFAPCVSRSQGRLVLDL